MVFYYSPCRVFVNIFWTVFAFMGILSRKIRKNLFFLNTVLTIPQQNLQISCYFWTRNLQNTFRLITHKENNHEKLFFVGRPVGPGNAGVCQAGGGKDNACKGNERKA
jgi:hypothetical protein